MNRNFNDFDYIPATDPDFEIIGQDPQTGAKRTKLHDAITAVFAAQRTLEKIPALIITADHPYAQWWGTNGFNGLAAMYHDRGIVPVLAINADSLNGPGATNMMSWAQIKDLVDRGWIECVGHGYWHVDKWNRINTGIQIQYTGALASATVQVQTAVPSTALVCSAAGDSVTSTFASDDTLAKVKTTLEAAGKWTVTLDPILTGSEPSSMLLGMNAARTLRAAVTFSSSSGLLATTGVDYPTGYPVTFTPLAGTLPSNIIAGVTYYAIRVSATTCRLATSLANALAATAISYVNSGTSTNNINFLYNQYFCAGGGIELRYNGTNPPVTYDHIWVRRNSSASLTIIADGVQFYSHTGSTGDINTIVAAIDALAEVECKLCDDGRTETLSKPSYMLGDELETNLYQTAYNEFSSRPAVLETGLPQQYIIRRHIEYVRDLAAANGITLKHFAQSGGNFYSWMATQPAAGMFRGNTLYRSITPFPMRRDKLGNFVVHRTLKNDETGATYYGENIAAIPRALCGHGTDATLEPWVLCVLMHVLKADGSSNYSITTLPNNYFDQYEADWVTFLNTVKRYVDAGLLRTITLDELAKMPRTTKMTNLWFNPHLENGGVSRAPAAGGTDGGFWIPGNYVARAATMSTFSITDGVLRWVNSSSSATEFLLQDVQLEQGKTYEISCDFTQIAYTAGAGLQWSVQSLHGNVKSLINPTTNWKFTGDQRFQSGRVAMRFQVPAAQGWTPGKVRASAAPATFDLSAAYNIKINVLSTGVSADIDCRGGTPSATTAKEIAAKINAAMAVDATYATKAEFHNIASVVNGYLTLTAPYIGADQTSSLSVSAGSSATGVAAIFGNATVDGRAQYMGPVTSEIQPIRLALRAAFQGTGEVRNFDLREVESAF